MADQLKTYRLDEATHKLIDSLVDVYGSRRKVIEAALVSLQTPKIDDRPLARERQGKKPLKKPSDK